MSKNYLITKSHYKSNSDLGFWKMLIYKNFDNNKQEILLPYPHKKCMLK